MTQAHPHPSAAQAPKPERVLHDKPIPLRLFEHEREKHATYATEEGRSQSNLAVLIYRMGMAQYELQRGQRQTHAGNH